MLRLPSKYFPWSLMITCSIKSIMLNVYKQAALNRAREARWTGDGWSQGRSCDGDRGKRVENSLVQNTGYSQACWVRNNLLKSLLSTISEALVGHWECGKACIFTSNHFRGSDVWFGNQGTSLTQSHNRFSRSHLLTLIFFSFFYSLAKRTESETRRSTRHKANLNRRRIEWYTKYGKWDSYYHKVYLCLPHGLRTAWTHHMLTWGFTGSLHKAICESNGSNLLLALRPLII